MTYRELYHKLQQLTVEQMDSDLTIVNLDIGESYPILDFVDNWNYTEKEQMGLDIVDGILDDNHPYFTYSE